MPDLHAQRDLRTPESREDGEPALTEPGGWWLISVLIWLHALAAGIAGLVALWFGVALFSRATGDTMEAALIAYGVVLAWACGIFVACGLVIVGLRAAQALLDMRRLMARRPR